MSNVNDVTVSRFGIHCAYCGSLLGVCKDQAKCKEESGFHIEEATRSGSSDHPLLETAHLMLGETTVTAPESLSEGRSFSE